MSMPMLTICDPKPGVLCKVQESCCLCTCFHQNTDALWRQAPHACAHTCIHTHVCVRTYIHTHTGACTFLTYLAAWFKTSSVWLSLPCWLSCKLFPRLNLLGFLPTSSTVGIGMGGSLDYFLSGKVLFSEGSRRRQLKAVMYFQSRGFPHAPTGMDFWYLPRESF